MPWNRKAAMLDLRQLQTFRMLATTSNFTRAAVELGCSQPRVTTHIKALERELGVPLFERCRFSKKVVLTAVGRQALEYAGRLLTLAEETKTAVCGLVPKQAEPKDLLQS